jgi:hypothetical protein
MSDNGHYVNSGFNFIVNQSMRYVETVCAVSRSIDRKGLTRRTLRPPGTGAALESFCLIKADNGLTTALH